ncbi:MAG: SDR family oxidoreductase [Clostridiales bacterium]|jgi:3-oxoacyl-[acyl-carrier protein] reductase|nr:SDR family oxidoreductase [Clostridiales bacterium]
MRRRVFITGSSRGIGFGIAKAFAQNGDQVAINGISDLPRLQEAAEELKTYDPCAEFFLADMSDYKAAEECFTKIKARGPVDVLINCAGAAYFGLFTEMTQADMDFVLRNNLISVFNACRLAAPDMVRAKRGAIINISSVWGITGASCEAVYAAAKAGVDVFTKSLAKELGPSGVRVNAIACGAFETRMNDRLTPEEKNNFTEGIPLGRFGQADEVGGLAVYLASGSASYLTGQIIALDGGLT